MPTARPPIDQWREKAALRPDSQAAALYNLEAVEMLRAERTLIFGGIAYVVHVPFLEGLKLAEIRREFDDLVQRDADDEPVDYHKMAATLSELFTDSLELIRACVKPKNWLLRWFWERRPSWNPFRRANNADWVRVTRFLLLCRTKSGVRFPTGVRSKTTT